jgi:hypothetical protein
MIKKVILSLVIILIVLLTATGFLYAKGSDSPKISKADQNEVADDEVVRDTNTFHITSNCNHGGTILPKGNQSLNIGDIRTFTITANIGYKLVWLRVDNLKIKDFSEGTYTFTGDGKNHTIHAHFKKIKTNGNNG